MRFFLCVSLAIIGICTMNVHATEGEKTVDNIIITRRESVAAIAGPETTFTGEVSVELSVPVRDESRLSGGLVTFQPKARSNWHTHPYGQLLIIMEGKGRVQEWDRPVQEVYAGDLVWFPAGVKHWHGAAPDLAMRHYALQEERDGSVVEWMEKVTDEQYGQ